MTEERTTAFALNTRAQQYVDANPTDSVAYANRLIDEAVQLQNKGRMVESEELLNRAEELLA